MSINDFLANYGNVSIKFQENNEDPEYDYQADFSVEYDNHQYGTSVVMKRDDEYDAGKLIEKILDSFVNRIEKEKKNKDFKDEDDKYISKKKIRPVAKKGVVNNVV